MKLSNSIIDIRSITIYCDYNFVDNSSAIKNFSNISVKKDRNFNIILNSFFSALINNIKRRFILNIIVAKANKILIIREI